MDLTTVRTMLFTPANRPDRFKKAKETGADGIVIDLEDAVSLAGKDEARQIVMDYFKNTPREEDFVHALRINSLQTPAGIKDVSAIIDHNVFPDVILLPKTEYAAEIKILDKLLHQKNIPYFALIETACGLHNADEIASSSKNIKGLCFGGGDLAADLGAVLAWEPMLEARARIVRAAAMAGIMALDVPYLKIHQTNDDELSEEARRVKAMGYRGKFAIHPAHIPVLLAAFSPTDDEIKAAQRIVDIYQSSKGNACEIDGKMVDGPVVRSAERILALRNRNGR